MDLVGDLMMMICETLRVKVDEIYCVCNFDHDRTQRHIAEVQVTTTWWVKNHVMVYRFMRIMTCRAIEVMRVGSPAYHS